MSVAVRHLAHGADLPLPIYATAGAAGMDLLAAVDAPVAIAPGERALVPTGLAIALPPGFELQVRPRSGLALRHGIVLANSPGTIDEDYRGEIQVIVMNAGTAPFTVERGMRIAQAVLAPVVRARWREVATLDVTERAATGISAALASVAPDTKQSRPSGRDTRRLARLRVRSHRGAANVEHRQPGLPRSTAPAQPYGTCSRSCALSSADSPRWRDSPAERFAPINAPGALSVSLDPANLPGYAVRTTMRMFAALAASLLFTFTYGTAAAKSRRAGIVLIPMLDILQSVPILGFLTFTVVFFMGLFPGRVLGLELAAIFAIFTSQAWNMAFSLYQSLKTVPADLEEAARQLPPRRHGSASGGWRCRSRSPAWFGTP